MNIKVTIPQTINAQQLHCYIGARYWEDSSFNGRQDDEDGTIARKLFEDRFEKYGGHEFLHLTIDLDNGKILDWPEGNNAVFNYKSCDINRFILTGLSNTGEYIWIGTPKGDTEYVIGPEFMNDYGDYFCPTVNEQGEIQNYDKGQMIESLEDWLENLKDYE